MRRVLATVAGALVLTGALSVPAHADFSPSHREQSRPGISGVLGDPLEAGSNIEGLRFGRLPLERLGGK